MNHFSTLITALTLTFMTCALQSTAQVDDIHMFGFIHSLVVHEPPLIPVPNNETATIYWINDVVKSTSASLSFTGQFGQLPSHVDNLPPLDNVGFQSVATPWHSSTGESFAESSINTILVTAANFIQWDLPTNPDPADPAGRSIVQNTETLFDWTNNEIPNMKYYIYGNWPEMDTESPFPPTVPTQSEIDDFHAVTIGEIGTFDQWWLQYQDALVASRPSLDVKLIPVGRLISKIYRDVLPTEIPFDELYEDSAPHGRANTYFLAGLISYSALYEQKVPDSYMPSDIIHPVIRENLSAINDFIWQQLAEFNFSDGKSRVFFSNPSNNVELDKQYLPTISPLIIDDHFTFTCDSDQPYMISVYSMDGIKISHHSGVYSDTVIDMSAVVGGVYFVHMIGVDKVNHTQRIVVK